MFFKKNTTTTATSEKLIQKKEGGKKRGYKPCWNMFTSKLGPNLQAEGSLSLSSPALWSPRVAKNGGKRGEAGGGESQEKVQVTLFFFLETNSGWTQGDARQFTKSQALLSHFSKPCSLETGAPLTHCSFLLTESTLTFKYDENHKVSAGFYSYSGEGERGSGRRKKTCAKLWLMRMKCPWIRAHATLREMVLAPHRPGVYF